MKRQNRAKKTENQAKNTIFQKSKKSISWPLLEDFGTRSSLRTLKSKHLIHYSHQITHQILFLELKPLPHQLPLFDAGGHFGGPVDQIVPIQVSFLIFDLFEPLFGPIITLLPDHQIDLFYKNREVSRPL